ncbi:MAG: S8 family serine peptidase [Actinomycetota bacterium]
MTCSRPTSCRRSCGRARRWRSPSPSTPRTWPGSCRFTASISGTTASGCFRKVNQLGKPSPLPPSGKGTGWDLEATLDVSMISVACPSCHIVVVEANSPGDRSLAKTDGAAARLGAQVISNSYGSRENGFALSHRQAYIHPGHTIVASAGDVGFTAASFPADLASVVSVGGTTLARAGGPRGWRESTWNDDVGAGGSGCSAYVAKPSWQHDRHCEGRTVADVSAVAANVPVFESSYGGWVTVDGTSIAAPLIAGIYGLAGNGGRVGPQDLYAHTSSLFDVTKGSNAFFQPPSVTCGDDYLCVARKGYDAPTGLGTPDGIGAF